jgi:hypothetical protein
MAGQTPIATRVKVFQKFEVANRLEGIASITSQPQLLKPENSLPIFLHADHGPTIHGRCIKRFVKPAK